MNVKFDDVFLDDTKNIERVPSDEYVENGDIAIVDQGKKKVIGYTNNKNLKICYEERIVFGDHTRIFKYIDIPFITGADGTKVLKIKDTNKYNYKYMYYYLKASYIPNTGYNRHFKWVKELEFEIPDIKVQKEIVQRLDKIQKMMDINEEQNELFEKIIKARFMELFGDPLLNPKMWEVKKLKELSNKIMSGNTPKGGNQVYIDNGITFFRSQNVWRNKLELEDIAYIDEETHKKMIRSSLKHNDLLITKTGRINTENSSLGRTALYDGPDDKANINGHVYLVRLNRGENHKFVLRILISEEYRKYIRRVCVGGIDKRQLNKEQIEEFPIIYPPKELQKQFTDFVEKIEGQEKELEIKFNEIKELQENLMNKYFK